MSGKSLREQIDALRIKHYCCDDSYYCCPMCDHKEVGLPPMLTGPKCYCDATDHNARVDQALVTLDAGAPRPEETKK